jgi:homoserine kinase type II
MRLERLRELRERGCAAIEATLASGRVGDSLLVELQPIARRAVEMFRLCTPYVEDQLVAATQVVVPLQPCIRDIWHEHVLFTGDQVSGIIDFGAMRTDCVATDVTRLLGSLVGDDAAGWKSGIEAYCEVRPLTSAESRLLSAFDQSAVLISPMNWLQWLYVDRRQFARRERVRERLAVTMRRLEHLSAQVNRGAN